MAVVNEALDVVISVKTVAVSNVCIVAAVIVAAIALYK